MNIFSTATGSGPWPGTNFYQASQIIIDELGQYLTFIPELPARRDNSDQISRAGAILVDLAIDTTAQGYCLVSRPTKITRYARSILEDEIEIFEQVWHQNNLIHSHIPVKIQCIGPITLAASLELPHGRLAISDDKALTDISVSLAEGLASYHRILTDYLHTQIVIQLDEPLLHQVFEGTVPGIGLFEKKLDFSSEKLITLINLYTDLIDTELGMWCTPNQMICHSLQSTKVTTLLCDILPNNTESYNLTSQWLDNQRNLTIGVAGSQRCRTSNDLIKYLCDLIDTLKFPREILTTHIGLSTTRQLASFSESYARHALTSACHAYKCLQDDPYYDI